jgi:hypothetical protein
MTPVELPTQSQGIKNVPTKDPPPWDQSVRSALQLYLSGAPRNEISRQLARARAFGALEALDRPGALYVIACFYAEEYVRSSSVSDLQLAKTAYRRLLEVAPGYVPSAPSLRQAKIEKLLNR